MSFLLVQCHYLCVGSEVLAELFGFQTYGELKPILALVSNEEECFLVTLEFQCCKLKLGVSKPGVPFGK